jgi:predicted O-linked N-acetylglucosamine transferase (SPINDLY family)
VNRKIKVGYVSYDFRNHAVGIQIQNMFEFHNKSQFEVIYGYAQK